MKILFWGEANGNSGPANVNREIRQNLTKSFMVIQKNNKLTWIMELVHKCILCQVVVVSGLSRKNCVAVKLAKTFKKKTVYIMHGCAEYECVINNQSNYNMAIEQERYLLENVDLILPVSKRYSKWVQCRYPQYAEKINYIYNGIHAPAINPKNVSKEKGTVIVTGADREIKNNRIIAEIVEELGGMVRLELCGTIYHEKTECYTYSHFTGMMPHGDFLEHLSRSELFVLNSIMESFSVATIEALLCGCSLLISEVAGVTDLLELEETDIIRDPMDKEEIRAKMLYLLENPNNERIMSHFVLEDWTYQKTVERLERLCTELV